MCWTCNINKLKAQIAKEDINVYKIVKKATKEYCISPFMDYTYYSKDIQPSLTLGVTIEPRSIFAKITEGYHSYSSVNFVCDSIVPDIFGGCVKTIQCGNRDRIFRVDNSLYLATFIIPSGYVYFTNEEGEIVSNKIRYTGKLATLGIFISQYQNFRYYKSQIMPTVKIRPKFERYRSVMGCVGELWNYDRFYIHEGYHSYLTEEMAKGRMCYAEIGIFEIPVGATVYINYAYREVVSTDIKYLGLLEE